MIIYIYMPYIAINDPCSAIYKINVCLFVLFCLFKDNEARFLSIYNSKTDECLHVNKQLINCRNFLNKANVVVVSMFNLNNFGRNKIL